MLNDVIATKQRGASESVEQLKRPEALEFVVELLKLTLQDKLVTKLSSPFAPE
jgi:hypothetical protein